MLTIAFEGEEREVEVRFDRDNVLWRRADDPVPATRIVLADAKGNVLCSVEGDEFTERYRTAPEKGGRDYALLLSPDGVRWLSEKEFYKEAKAINKLREEAGERKDRPASEPVVRSVGHDERLLRLSVDSTEFGCDGENGSFEFTLGMGELADWKTCQEWSTPVFSSRAFHSTPDSVPITGQLGEWMDCSRGSDDTGLRSSLRIRKGDSSLEENE